MRASYQFRFMFATPKIPLSFIIREVLQPVRFEWDRPIQSCTGSQEKAD